MSDATVFVSYRRKQTAWVVDAVVRHLGRMLGPDSVIRDIDSIGGGENFRLAIRKHLEGTDLLLAVISDGWARVRDDSGRLRLDDPKDTVRLELEWAHELGIPVVPLLVDGASVPRTEDIPHSLEWLPPLNGLPVRSGRDFDRDMEHLVDTIRRRTTARRDSRETLGLLQEHWEGGDWTAAQRVVETALARAGFASTAAGRSVAARGAVLARLREVTQAIERSDFAAALAAAKSVREAEAPRNFPLVVALASVGARLQQALAAGDPDAVRDLERETRRALDAAAEQAFLVVPGRRELEEAFRRAGREVEYLGSVRAYREGHLSKALEDFEAYGDFREARDYAARCRTWGAVHGRLSARDFAGAKGLLRQLAGRDEDSRVERVRQWCNRGRFVVPALERLASGPFVESPPIPSDLPPTPYRAAGLDPTASMDEVKEAGYGLSPDRRSAWDALRVTEQRLRADFALYRVEDPPRAARALAHLEKATHGASPDEMLRNFSRAETAPEEDGAGTGTRAQWTAFAAGLGEDEGVFHALLAPDLKDHDAAERCFRERTRAEPHEPRHLHHLALATAARIQGGEADEEAQAVALKTLSWALAAVLASDRFWNRWWADRKPIYEATREQVREARLHLRSHFTEFLRTVCELHPGADATFLAELDGASAVEEGNGIPLARPEGAHAVVGHEGAKALGITDRVAAWARGFGEETAFGETWQARVRIGFSELAEVATLQRQGRHAEAVERLGRPAPAVAWPRPEDANPGLAGLADPRKALRALRHDALRRSHHHLAVAAVAAYPVDVPKALDHWRAACASSEKTGSTQMLLREVREAAVGRAAFLQGDAPTSKERKKIDALNDAVLLLQSVVDAGWDDAEGTVTRALVEALLNRAVHLSNEYDDEEGARYDARKACALAPRSQRAIAVMVGASLHYARNLFMQGRRGRAEALLKEIQGDLAEGLRIHPGDAVLEGFRGNLAELEATIAGKGPEHLRGVVEKLKVSLPGETAADAASRRFSEAMFLENRQEFAGAVAIYRELVLANPGDAGIRNKLAWCYRLWILQELSREGGGPRAREILEEARTVCSDAACLRDLFEAAEGGEGGGG